jgi:hypothetical protein
MPEVHRREAVATNQKSWELLGRDDRSADDDLLLLHAAHASAYHWRVIGTPVHWARADWLLAHVYTVLGWGEQALVFARRCLLTTETASADFADFDRAYAFEAMARALAATGDHMQARAYLDQARTVAESVTDPEDRAILDGDLAAEPWFGLPGD